MSAPNRSFDPVEVDALKPAALDAAVAAGTEAFAAATDLDALAAAKSAHLGDRAPVALARREIGALPPQAKADAGKRVNLALQALNAAYSAREQELRAARAAAILVEQKVDVTLPVTRTRPGAATR